MQQPPPRKGNFFKVCKNLHTEQLSKLQAKNQQECDLLEDIRNFTKQRSAIEKSYGEALCKISGTYQNRKIACVPDIRLEDGSEAWNVYNVWRTVLDETEKLGKARLAAVEVFHQRISEDAKHTRQNKVFLGKRLEGTLTAIQKELQLQVQDLDRTKRCYYEEENVAYDAREKASAAEEKLKRKKGSIFQSITSLQKNSAKFTAKKEMCDEKSAGARNDYLLCLASTQAHQRRYHEIDFERLLRGLECDMFDKVAEYFTLLCRTELLTCTATQNSFNRIKKEANTITRGYNLRCYLTFYPMLGKNIQYDFEPCKGDQIEIVTIHDENSKEQLNAESVKCVEKVIKEVKIIREATKKIQKLQETHKDGDLPSDVENKIEDIRQIIRRSETTKCKAEAKLEMLRAGNIEVEDYSKSIEMDNYEAEVATPISRTGSTASLKEEVDSREREMDGEAFIQEDFANFASAKEFAPDEAAAPQATLEPGWEPSSADWGDEPVSPLPPVSNGPQDEAAFPKCIVLYNYTAQNPDELSIVENEELEMISEGDGDGWVQARNYKGEVGYIPQNYIEMEEGAILPPIQTSEVEPPAMANGAIPGYEYEPTEEGLETAPPSEVAPPPAVTIIRQEPVAPFQLPASGLSLDSGPFCIAMYDYEATCDEELTFEEGQVIRILKKSVHDVDDGWWEGEIDGKVGLFPSLVVDECGMDGEPFTPDEDTLSSPRTTPPMHTPPEVPGFLLPPDKVIITQPTPEVETAEEAMELRKKQKEKEKETGAAEAPVSYYFETPNFELELSGDHQNQYNRQFSSSPDSETTNDKEQHDQQYAELVSSPDASNVEVEEPERLKDVSKSLPNTPSPDTVEEQKDEGKTGGASSGVGGGGGVCRPSVAPPPPPSVAAAAPAEEKRIDSPTAAQQGLGVAQIVITAATPMKDFDEEEPPGILGEDSRVEEEPPGILGEDSRVEADQTNDDDVQSEDTEGEATFLDDDRPPPPPPAPEGGGGSGVEERREEYESEYEIPIPPPLPILVRSTIVPSSIETKRRGEAESLDSGAPTPKSPSNSDGPPDLDPEKLKTLEKIKESIA